MKKFARVISADSHVMEPPDLWEKALGDRYADYTPRRIDEHLGKKGSFFFTGHHVLKYGRSDYEAQKIGFQEAGWKPEVRVRFQKEAGVDAELMNATYMLLIMQGRQRAVVRAAARVFNDWLADFCAYDPKRLIGIAMIPMDDIDWAVAELERVAKRGLRGAIIHLYPPEGCAPYRDHLYDRFWARAQELDMPLTLHIITGRVPDPLHFHTREEQGESPQSQIALMYEVMGVLANEFIFGTIPIRAMPSSTSAPGRSCGARISRMCARSDSTPRTASRSFLAGCRPRSRTAWSEETSLRCTGSERLLQPCHTP